MTCPTTGAPHRYVTRGHESGDVVRFCPDCRQREPADERTHRHDQVIVPDDADCPLCGAGMEPTP